MRYLVACLLFAGCAPASTGSAPAPANDAGQTDATAASIEPAASCPPGTRPAYGTTDCVPVGATVIPDGFEAQPDGWGFRPIRPAAACQGATRAEIGRRDCVPLDDCTAAFPPAGTSVVVSTSGASFGGVPVVATLKDAIARTPAGGTIAVDRGTYAGASIAGDVHVVGRCASDTVISATATDSPPDAFDVAGASFELRSVTVEGFAYGVRANGGTTKVAGVFFRDDMIPVSGSGGAQISVDAVAVERQRPSAKPSQAFEMVGTGRLAVTRADTREVDVPLFAGKGGALDVRRSLMEHHGEKPSALFVLAAYDATIDVAESAMTTRARAFATAGDSQYQSKGKTDSSKITIRASSLEQSGAALDDFLLVAEGSATMDVEGTTIRHRSKAVFDAWEAGSHLVVKDVTAVSEERDSTQSETVVVDRAAEADVDGLASIGATSGLDASDSATKLTMANSLVSATRPTGQLVYGVMAYSSASVSIHACTFLDGADSSIAIMGEAHVDVDTTFVRGTKRSQEGPGSAVLVTDDGQIAVSDCLFEGNEGAGVDVYHAGGVVQRTRIVGNTTGVGYFEATIREGAAAVDGRDVHDVVLVDDVIEDNQVSVAEESTWTVNAPDAGP